MRSFDLSLYLILDRSLCRSNDNDIIQTAISAISGGVSMIQLRDKESDTQNMIELGHKLMNVIHSTGIPLIVNDNIQVALAINADGLHIGQYDIIPQTARKLLGKNRILGLSINNEKHLNNIDNTIIDYIGVGPIFDTKTKHDYNSTLGIEGLSRIISISKIPSVAIGGLKKEHVYSILYTGVNGIAFGGAICKSNTPKLSTQKIIQEIFSFRTKHYKVE